MGGDGVTYKSKSSAYASRYAKLSRNGVEFTMDATPTRRMLQALARIGHSFTRIAEALDTDRAYISSLANASSGGGPRERVYVRTAKAVEAYYQANQNSPLSDPGAKRAITYARKRGWAAPAAWDDITSLDEKPKGVTIA